MICAFVSNKFQCEKRMNVTIKKKERVVNLYDIPLP